MNETSSHWGSLEIGATEETRGPLRNLVKTELADTRSFVDRLYTDFTRTGRRAVTARLMERQGDLPWFIMVHKPGRLTKR
jgi:hypothetical protein